MSPARSARVPTPELLQEDPSVAKHFPNVNVDPRRAWILAPRSSKEFVMRFLATAPADKVMRADAEEIFPR